jgi:hypothetical protein
LFEPAVTSNEDDQRRVRRRQAYEVIFSHFSEALTFFVTFLRQGKKVKGNIKIAMNLVTTVILSSEIAILT